MVSLWSFDDDLIASLETTLLTHLRCMPADEQFVDEKQYVLQIIE